VTRDSMTISSSPWISPPFGEFSQKPGSHLDRSENESVAKYR
jgi:hypothetical protein